VSASATGTGVLYVPDPGENVGAGAVILYIALVTPLSESRPESNAETASRVSLADTATEHGLVHEVEEVVGAALKA
jgi:hypothetical protein